MILFSSVLVALRREALTRTASARLAELIIETTGIDHAESIRR
jgi:hypothetical protein